MPRFDPDRPHGQVSGLPGVHWQQNGHYFTRDGTPVDGDPDREREVEEIATQLGDPAMEPEVREALRKRMAALKAAPEPAKVAPPQTDDMRLAENRRLKAQLEQYGEPWQSVAHAKLFLDGKA